jgi:2-polyprenyl-3-methyl-5-hydroxy-6-metoxy-1,4-benzoquinol methylase
MMAAQEQGGVAPDSHMARFLEVVGDVSGLTVLDAGCGEGYLSRLLAQCGAQATAIDIAPKLVEIARAKDPDDAITYAVADLSQPLSAYQATSISSPATSCSTIFMTTRAPSPL